jgi:hypothetical protein
MFIGTRRNEDGTFTTCISWMDCKPISVRLTSEGYEEKEVLLGPDEDGETIQLKLARVTSSEEGPLHETSGTPGTEWSFSDAAR